MQARDVHQIVSWLEAGSVLVWLDGGWGVDALLGVQTRPHDDLDLVIALHAASRAQHLLGVHSFACVVDERPTRFVLRDADDRRIDFHTVTFEADGGGMQQLQDGTAFRYPPAGFRGTGAIDGHLLHCLSAEVQMLCHTGYEPDEQDRHDVQLLHARFGLALPPGYGHT